MYAEVIIPLALPKNYTWSVPADGAGSVQPGSRVEVTLRNKKYAGIVKRLHEDKPAGFEPREIGAVLDAAPLVGPKQLALWEWMASYYLCTEGEVMAAALPAHIKLTSESRLVFAEEYGDDFSALDHDEFIVAEALLLKKELSMADVQTLLDSGHVYSVVKGLIDKGVCFVWEALKESYKEKKETYVELHPDYAGEEKLASLLNDNKALQRAEKQLELLLAYLHLLRTEKEVTRAALLKKSGASDAQLRGLVNKGILVTEQRQVDRIPAAAPRIDIDFTLTDGQSKALASIRTQFAGKPVALLHGVTASGKTLVYIKLIEETIRAGRQALYMVPEIALTTQIVRRLQKHFGGHLGVYHSKFNQHERYEIWNRIRSGDLKVILGARSAVFLPFTDLGLVVVDEEQDGSYKQQDPAPRYNARDTAIWFAAQWGAHTVLGSATPSLESYHQAQTGKYAFAELPVRFNEVALPSFEVIDTKRFVGKDREKVICAPALENAIRASIAAKKQVILFRNRRGYSPYQVCRVCGWIPQCLNCDVSLTFHKLSNKLLCHYCGMSYAPIQTCLQCGSHDWVQRNFGTEKIEEALDELFPEARVARMDVDSVRGKLAHDTLIRQFELGQIDVLVGTQMVVKGLDFDNVNLVGILDADSLLSFADFRVNERAFQLMEQVSGRAGRRDGQGKVLVQAANTTHPVLQWVAAHDYRAMYAAEIAARRQFGYPPFTRVIRLIFRHKMADTALDAANLAALHLSREFAPYLSGPAAPAIARVRNQYIFELLLKLPRDGATLAHAREAIRQQRIILGTDKKFRSVVLVADVDPM